MREWRDATMAIVRRDATIYFSYRTQIVSQFIGPLFTISIFYYVSHLLTNKSFHSPDGYFGFVVVGLVIVQVLTISLGTTPASVRQELVAGTIERFIVSAHGALWGILAMMIFPLISAFITSLVMLLIATVIFGLPLAATAPLAIPVALLGAIAFMPFGLVLTAAVIAVKQTASAAQFIIAGIAIIGGLYFPVVLLPNWISWMSEVQPFTPATDLLRHLMVGTPLTHPAIEELAKLTGFALLLLPVGILLLRAAIRYGQRAGTIVEY